MKEKLEADGSHVNSVGKCEMGKAARKEALSLDMKSKLEAMGERGKCICEEEIELAKVESQSTEYIYAMTSSMWYTDC